MMDKLTTIQIQRFYNNLQKNGRVQRKEYPELKDKNLSPRVVRGIHTLLSNCLDQAVAERLILVNPAQGCKLPKLEKKEMRILPQEKIGMYLAEAERRGLLAAFYLELTTGLRRGELLALLWTDLNAEDRTISVTKQVNRIKGELVVSPPKTQNSVRTLAIPQQAVDMLIEEHKKHPGNAYMFPSPKTGTMYDPDAFRRTHDKILKVIGTEHVRFHDMRHLFATLSLKNGVDVKTLSGALGHYSAGFTLNTYTHATTQMKQDAADTIWGGHQWGDVKLGIPGGDTRSVSRILSERLQAKLVTFDCICGSEQPIFMENSCNVRGRIYCRRNAARAEILSPFAIVQRSSSGS